MLEIAVLLAALVWPPECVSLGALYRDAAMLRDEGKPLDLVLTLTNDARVKRMLIHVYERPDMSPKEWQWFVIGACVGEDRRRVKV